MSVRTWAGRFNIVEGQVREEGPWLGTFAHRPADDEERTLHVLVEPALPGSEDTCAQLVEVMGRLFQRENLSLTGALARSLQAAHEDLREWNRKSLREHQVGAGASCLILRGRSAYLAQVGPSLAFTFRDGQLTRLAPEEPSAGEALGLADDLRPELSAFELAPGDLLLVVSSRLAAVADQATVAGVLARGADDALAELYLLTRDFANFSALLVSCFEQADRVPEPPGPVPGAPSPPARPFTPEPPPRDPKALSTLDDDGGPGGGATAVLAPPTPFPDRAPSHLPGFDPAGAPRPNGGNGHSVPSEARYGLAARIDTPPARPVVRLRGPETAPRYRFQRTTTLRIGSLTLPRPWALLAAAIAFIGVVALCTLPGSRQADQGDRFQALLGEAGADYRAALSEDDPAARRTLLTAALAELDEAEEVTPDDQQAATLRADVRSQLAALDAVVDLGQLELVADLGPLVSGTLAAERIVVGGSSLFVLDGAGGRVLELPLGGTEPTAATTQVRTVLQEADFAGALRAARPRFIMWSRVGAADAPGGQGRLLILDEDRRLFGYVPGGTVAPLTWRDPGELGSVDAAATFAGNLYILDGASGQVWRYLPTDSGFDSERSLLVEADLEGTRELAVDGDVYLLTDDGRLRRFVDGLEQPFPMTGIDRALLGPVSLTSDGADGLLVADRGNRRLVVFDAEGRFRRQLVSASLTDLRSAAVDAEAGRLYLLMDDSVFAADLPSP